MGQANAARDKLYDLRLCDLRWVRLYTFIHCFCPIHCHAAGTKGTHTHPPHFFGFKKLRTHTQTPKHSGKDAQGFDLSGAIMADAKFQKVNFKEAVMSKAYAKARFITRI